MSARHDGPAATRPDTAPGVCGVPSGSYRVDPAASMVRFRIRKLGLFTVRGSFTVRDGFVQVGATSATVRVDVDAASFTTASARRDADVRSPRFLGAERFPLLSWAGELHDGEQVAAGTLRGRAQAPMPARVQWVSVTPAGPRVGVSMQVDRTAVGVAAATGVVGRLLDVEVELALVAA